TAASVTSSRARFRRPRRRAPATWAGGAFSTSLARPRSSRRAATVTPRPTAGDEPSLDPAAGLTLHRGVKFLAVLAGLALGLVVAMVYLRAPTAASPVAPTPTTDVELPAEEPV